MARPSLEFWFDFTCPYAYLASTRIEALVDRTGAELVVCPFLLGGVFRARGVAQNLASTLNPAKAAHNAADLVRHAELFGVTLASPHHHPMRTVTALRALLAVGTPSMELVHRFYAAYWVRGIDLSTDEGVATILEEAGLDPDAVLTRARSPEIEAELRARTDQALERGVFGAPAMVVGGRQFWGQDRLDEVERALGGSPPRAAVAAEHDGSVAPVQFWFDYSSPFTYVAATRVQRMFGPRVRWRPMLLGGVFRLVGAPNVPLHAMNDARRAWSNEDASRQAAAAGVALNWPERFPLHTVLALRVTLLAGPDSEVGRRLIRRIFDACWVEGADPKDPDTLAALCGDVGLDGVDLVSRASDPAVKRALREATSAAVDDGVFGAPTFVVGDELFWGNDRLELALREARKS
jgi:2-hydroxychromene-2-carboxylate isomerase